MAKQHQDLDPQERALQMELLDVLTDIATPDNSDVEGEEVEELTMPAVRQALLNAQTYPTTRPGGPLIWNSTNARCTRQKLIRWSEK
jgi:hypothetical protein